uniref:Uncharacterized protein n=1 Tax=viral metagenome TaxID=1070528 RepID=A0A6M3LCW8_9ZZZZ
MQNSIPFHFRLDAASPGWWVYQPTDATHARRLREATVWETDSYLQLLPHFYVIAIRPLTPTTWLCVPYNVADAKQRGWNGEPRRLELVSEAIEPFELISARASGFTHLLYREVAYLNARDNVDAAQGAVFDNMTLSGVPRAWLPAASIILSDMQQQIERERAAAEEAIRVAIAEQRVAEHERLLEQQAALASTTEGRIQWYLNFVGASLVDWRRSGRQLEVTWQYEGYTHTATVSDTMRGVGAGICLSGTAGEHNLSSLVLAIQEARRLHRFDMPRSSYI